MFHDLAEHNVSSINIINLCYQLMHEQHLYILFVMFVKKHFHVMFVKYESDVHFLVYSQHYSQI